MSNLSPNYAATLTPRYQKIMDLAMRGNTPVEIANLLGTPYRTVVRLMSAPNFEHQLAIRRAQYEEKHDESILRHEEEAVAAEDVARAELRKNALQAAQKMVDLLDDESPTIQLKTSAEILNRVGVCSKVGGASAQAAVIINISEKDAAVIKETLSDA